MADWSITYPLDISPTGTTVEDGFEKHVLELTKIYGHLNNLRNIQAGTVAPSGPNTNEVWLDTSTTPASLKEYSSGTWNDVIAAHASSHEPGGTDAIDISSLGALMESGGSLTGALNFAVVATAIVATATCAIGAATGNIVSISCAATATITAFTTAPVGAVRELTFDGITTIVSSTGLSLPAAANITTAAGDKMTVISRGNGSWVCSNYSPYSVSPIPSTDGNLTANSDALMPTQKAIKSYVDNSKLITIIQDVKNAGTHGGTFSSGAWRTRTLNTYQVNQIGLAALSSNQFVLPAGTYYIYALCPARYVQQHKARLQNITDGSTSILGQTASCVFADYDGVSNAILSGVITITGNKTFEIQHYSNASNSDDGFGIALNAGVNEIYTIVEITKLS